MAYRRSLTISGRLARAIAAILVALPAVAQQPGSSNKSPFLTGSVKGAISDGDTKLPIRFAEIRLVPQPVTNQNLSPITPGATAPKEDLQLQIVTGTSEFDGSLRLDGVPVGDYFVSALRPGYVTLAASTRADVSEDQLEALLASLPTVHISPGKVASINLVLHRGAVIAGRLRFADGTPAIGQTVTWEQAEEPDLRGKIPSARLESLWRLNDTWRRPPTVLTDDEGRYRIFGLPPSKYVVSTLLGVNQNSAVQVILTDGSSSPSVAREHMYPELIPVFAPGTFRRTDARIFEVHGDEQITDADLKIDPDGLHTLKGRVLAAQDRHAPNGVMVHLRENEAKRVGRFAEIEDDGSFQFHYLPTGSYTLEILANDLAPPDENKQPRRYKTVRLTAVIGDHDVVLHEVLMTLLKPGEQNEDSQF